MSDSYFPDIFRDSMLRAEESGRKAVAIWMGRDIKAMYDEDAQAILDAVNAGMVQPCFLLQSDAFHGLPIRLTEHPGLAIQTEPRIESGFD